MFLSEPQLFQCDVSLALTPLIPTYHYHLNSEDKFYPELALEQRQAHSGTLALWHSALDPFIPTSPAVLPLLLSIQAFLQVSMLEYISRLVAEKKIL